MEDFKLKSIDEFDFSFVNGARVDSRYAAPVAKQETLIPEMETSTQPEAPIEQAAAEVPAEEKPRTPRPLEPIGQTPSPYAQMVAEAAPREPLNLNDDAAFEESEAAEEKKAKSGKGILAGKIISIVMLVVTVVTFLLGCFTATFLDTFELGSICISTQCMDANNPDGSTLISKGALLISKKLEPTEYAQNTFIVVPVTQMEGTEEKTYATICGINGVTSLGAASELFVYDYARGTQESILSTDCKGEVMFFIPALAGILNFALQAGNAILVCALFVLLAAFWCLLIVFLSKASKKGNDEE